MMDIRPKKLGIYNVIFQSQVLNNKDASLFINKSNQLGINTSGLGYGGKIEEGKWHRIIFSVDNNTISTFIDGNKIGTSSSANSDKWILRDVAYFFADEDGEEGVVDIAELRYWDVGITGVNAQALGGVEQEDPDGINVAPALSKGGALYDLSGRRISSQTIRLKPGLYIINGQKIVIK